MSKFICPVCQRAECVCDQTFVVKGSGNKFSDDCVVTETAYTSEVAIKLLNLADLAEAKGKEYQGNTYMSFGPIMAAFFPNGAKCETTEDWNRLGIFHMLVHKMLRYAATFGNGGHVDSADDIAVYGAILSLLTKNAVKS